MAMIITPTPRWLEPYQATGRASQAQKGPPPGGALTVLPWNIPPRLKYARAWAVWRYELENGRWSKPPYVPPIDGSVLEKAEPSNPETWRSFEQALKTYKDDREWDGVSFALDYRWGVVGVDLDHVSQHVTEAQRIVESLHSYTEQTPGRDGLRIFVLGGLPDGRRRRDWVEMYTQRRFLTVTGNHVEGTPKEIMQSPNLYSVWQRWLQQDAR